MSLVLKSSFELNFIRVNAKDRYYKKLEGVIEPERKKGRLLVRNL